jgi:hypothetical protein
MPAGHFAGRYAEPVTIPLIDSAFREAELFERACILLSGLVNGQAEPLIEWLRSRTATQSLPFELTVKEADLETVEEFAKRRAFNVLAQHNQPNPD